MPPWLTERYRYGVPATCLAGVIIATKALMLGEMRETPICLLFAQMITVAIVIQLYGPLTQSHFNGRFPDIRQWVASRSVCTWIWTLAMAGFDSAHLVLSYKIIRFFGSLPGAIMILSMPVDKILHRLLTERSLTGGMQCLCCLLTFCVTILCDFRLNQTARDMSVAWLVVSNAAKLTAQKTWKGRSYSGQVPQ